MMDTSSVPIRTAEFSYGGSMEKNFIRKEVDSTHALGQDGVISRSKLVNPSFSLQQFS